MESLINQNPQSEDLLAAIEESISPMENSAQEDLLASIQNDAIAQESADDILSMLDSVEAFVPTIEVSTPTSSTIFDKFKFVFHYVAVSVGVFGILLVAANFSAYFDIALNYISPSSLKASSTEIAETLTKSKITVFASESNESATGKIEEANDLKKKLEDEHVTIKENILSPKKLIPTTPSIKASLDIVPYENRLVVPRIGKNVPLVDVEPSNNFDFDHMENIFMTELQKWVVRYPGTPIPGEYGNTFIFGHSSNYPWEKGAYNQVFALLDELQFGDEIIIYYNQKKYTYIIREKKIVKPGDVKVLERDNTKKELSLMTCWPVGTTLKRMIVFAELQEDTNDANR